MLALHDACLLTATLPAQPAGSRNASRLRQNKERGDTKFWRRFNASPWAASRHQRRI